MSEEVIIHRDLAEHEAKARWEEARDRLRYSVEYAQAGLKGLFIANGGAILALLTFAGNSNKIIEPCALWLSFILFGIGVASDLAAYIAAYCSQTYIMNQEVNLSRQAMSDARELGKTYDSQSWEKKGDNAVKAGLVLACIALASFCGGALTALDAIT